LAKSRRVKTTMPQENFYWVKSGTNQQISRFWFKQQIDGSKQVYDSYELEFRKQAHQDWNVLFDPQNRSSFSSRVPIVSTFTRTKICTSHGTG
jgi:hypothetical protein